LFEFAERQMTMEPLESPAGARMPQE
jgi:hypothetical protein